MAKQRRNWKQECEEARVQLQAIESHLDGLRDQLERARKARDELSAEAHGYLERMNDLTSQLANMTDEYRKEHEGHLCAASALAECRRALSESLKARE